MEINITKFFKEENADDYSGSVATHGANVGKETYEAACLASSHKGFNSMLDSPEAEAAFKKHIAGYGAWTDEEIAEWDIDELTGLFIQIISAEMKECDLNCADPDWEAYEADDSLSHNIFKAEDGEVYFSLD